MRSIKRRFNKIVKRNYFWSSYLCFAEAIKFQQFSKEIIYYWFNRLVEKSDYAKNEKREILKHLCSLSNKREEGIKKR